MQLYRKRRMRGLKIKFWIFYFFTSKYFITSNFQSNSSLNFKFIIWVIVFKIRAFKKNCEQCNNFYISYLSTSNTYNTLGTFLNPNILDDHRRILYFPKISIIYYYLFNTCSSKGNLKTIRYQQVQQLLCTTTECNLLSLHIQ